MGLEPIPTPKRAISVWPGMTWEPARGMAPRTSPAGRSTPPLRRPMTKPDPDFRGPPGRYFLRISRRTPTVTLEESSLNDEIVERAPAGQGTGDRLGPRRGHGP